MTRKKKVESTLTLPFGNHVDGTHIGGFTKYKIFAWDKPVSWKNYTTGELQTLPHLVFCGHSGGSIRLVTKVVDLTDKKEYVINRYHYHVNVYSSIETNSVRIDGKGYKIYYQNFCTGANGIHGEQLIKNPEITALTCAEILKEQNIDSPAYDSSRRSVHIGCLDRIICDKNGTAIDPAKASYLSLIKRCSDKAMLPKIYQELASIPKNRWYYKHENETSYRVTSINPKGASGLSSYYPIIDSNEVAENLGELPKQEVDIAILGLGSAGGNIIEQLMRTTMVSKYLVCDFDMVEKKNLRNQPFNAEHIGYDKAYSTHHLIMQRLAKGGDSCIHFKSKFQEIQWKHYTTKYIVLGFDSIATRLEAFKMVADGTIQAEYIIDTRYDDLEASIYFVDVKDKVQMDYYYQQLLSDGNILESTTAKAEEGKFKRWDKNTIAPFVGIASRMGGCGGSHHSVGIEMVKCNCSSPCGSTECIAQRVRIFNECKIPKHIVDEFVAKRQSSATPVVETTCVKWNIIDIYKFASSYVTCTIREIQDKRPKQFTHIEVTTDGLPKQIVMKK